MTPAYAERPCGHPQARPQLERLVSLDVFRGLTIASMILVNNPGSSEYVYSPLTHAEWHGWTPTDLIFPFFLFIVGVAITFSLAGPKARGEGLNQLGMRTLRRTLVLFVLGVLLTNFPYYTFSTLRIPGVLQRIGVCYFFAVLLFLEVDVWGQTAVMFVLLSVYWLLMTVVPVPGYGAGVLEREGNLAAYVDTLLLNGHLLRHTSDPEGLLSTIPAVATTLSGVLAGQWLRTARRARAKMLGLFVAGMAAIVVGQVMNRWFPINKNLWTSSYAVFTSGMALVFLGICYWLVDIKGYQRWATPFVVFGMNAISVYVLATLGACLLDLCWVVGPAGTLMTLRAYIYDVFFASWAGPLNGSLCFALVYVGVWFFPMALLYHKGIFLKI